mgnify:CR=1 FL=1
MDSGIYLIQCGDIKYVGQSRDINKRIIQHKSNLKNNRHANIYMQRLWNKYSEQFEFIVIEYCNINELDDNEIYWINKLNTIVPNGMNMTDGGYGGYPSEEARKKISDSKIGKKHTEEHKQKVSDSLIGNKRAFGYEHTEETKDKIREYHSGNSWSLGLKRIGGYSEYQSVSFIKSEDKWQSQFRYKNKSYYVGRYKTELEAAEAYDLYVIANNIDRPLNFDRGNYAN